MTKKLSFVFLLGITAFQLSAQKMDGDKFHNLTMGFQTPHLDWAKELSGGRLNALFVISLDDSRHVVEAAQRMDVGLDAVTTAARLRILGITADNDGFYGNFFNGTSETDKAAELIAKLDQRRDVIVLWNNDLKNIPPRAKVKLLRQVKEGSGLLLWNVKDFQSLDKMLGTSAPAGRGEILALAGVADRKKLDLRCFSFGKGRIVVLNGSLWPYHYTSRRWWADYEDGQALLGRTLLWTAGRDSSVAISCSDSSGAVKVEVKSGKPGTLELRLRDEFNQLLKTESKSFGGDATIDFALPPLFGGGYRLDMMVRLDGKTDNFGYYPFTVKAPVSAEIVADCDAVKGFEPIKFTLKLSQPAPGATAVVSLADSPYGRVCYKREFKLGDAKDIPIEIKDYHMPTMAAFAQVEVSRDGAPLCRADKPFFFPLYNKCLPSYLESCWEYLPIGPDRLRTLAENDTMGWSGITTRIEGGRPGVQNYMLLNQRVMAHVTFAGGKAENGKFVVPDYSSWLGHAPRLGEEFEGSLLVGQPRGGTRRPGGG